MNLPAFRSAKGHAAGELTSVREATLDLLRALGVDTVFGNPGSTELPFLDRWPDDIRYVLGLQEASVVAMADGHARATGRAAFVNLHSAAGVGHGLGNVFTAYRNRAPMVIIAGQQARSLLSNLPFLGATSASEFPKPYVKYSIEPARAEDVPAAIAHAYHIAMQRPQGPTFVSVPADDWSKPCLPVRHRIVSADVAPDSEMIKLLANLLDEAERPVLIAGAEVDEETAGPALVALAERLNAPVMTAPFSARMSFPEDHPLFAGFLAASPAEISETLIKHDLILVVGAPVFTYHVAGDSPLMRSDVAIAHLTNDPDAAASAPAGTSILGSLSLGLAALASTVARRDRAAPALRQRKVAERRGEMITAAYCFARISETLQPGAVVVEEAPSMRPAMQEQIVMREWGSFFTMASGGLGYSLPAAVGVALARPDRQVVCLIGDGSFMYSPQALWTAVQHNTNLGVIILNNSGYGALRSFSRVLQIRDAPGIDVPGLDFVQLAEGMGCPARRVDAADRLDQELSWLFERTGPAVLEVMIDPEVPELYK